MRMKRLTWILAAGATCLAQVSTAFELVDFARPNHCWLAGNHVADVRQTATGYAFNVTSNDPWCIAQEYLTFPTAPAGAAYLHIELETDHISDPHSFQFFWHKAKEPFAESRAVLLKPDGGNPCSRFAVRLPVGAIDTSEPLKCRIDPPGRSAIFNHVEYRRLRVEYLSHEFLPQFSAPPVLSFAKPPLELSGDGWTLRHDRLRMGAFAFCVRGKTWAEGYPNETLAIRGPDGQPETLDWSKGTFNARIADGRIETCASVKDIAGRKWTWRRTFSAHGGELHLKSSIAVDRPAGVYHVPYLTLFVDRASAGRKSQALLPGIEYLADEPSSNEKDLRGPQANRLIPAAHRLCYPMMAIADATGWFALEWKQSVASALPFAPVFDTPDRQFRSGGHLFALWAPGVGPARDESDIRVMTAVPFTGGTVDAVLTAGAGNDMTDVFAARLTIDRLPPVPALDATHVCDTLARGWLDSGVREGLEYRHAIGEKWLPRKASDVPALMLWLASVTQNTIAAKRLTATAMEMIAAFPVDSPERCGWGGCVTPLARPAAPLVYGDAMAYSKEKSESTRKLARQFASGKRIWRKPADKPLDFGETLSTNHCNGYSAMMMNSILSGALWTGDEAVIADTMKAFDRFTAIYGNDVPRGAQPWEMPLHTPDILASAQLVLCYVKAYLLSGDQRYLVRARYWARTGMSMIYLVDPPVLAASPIGRYATTGVIGATKWKAPNWIGLPVQWCGLAYAGALVELAGIETDAREARLWRHLAKGIASSGIDQCFRPEDGERAGLLPDSFDLLRQERFDPPLCPGILQEGVSSFVGLPYYNVACAVKGVNMLVHVPGCVNRMQPEPGEIARIAITAWPKKPYSVFFTRLSRPSVVKADGKSVPFRFQDGVMAVSLQPGDKSVLLVLEK